MIDEDLLNKWDCLIQSLLPKTELVVLESQNAEGSSFLAAFPNKKWILKPDSARFKQEFNAIAKENLWRFGFISYDVKNAIEHLKSENKVAIDLPDVWFIEPELCLEWNHNTNTWIFHKGNPSDIEENSPNLAEIFQIKQFKSSFEKDEYIKTIKKIKAEIKEGLVYEVNLSRMISAKFEGSDWELFRAMRKAGPVPMAAFIKTKNWTICSSSPELYVEKQGFTIRSKPIKGTKKRAINKAEDEQIKQSLIQSEKEKAENLMIVDLVRNDFNKIAEIGSVFVSKLFAIEAFSTVYQMVSTVEAKLKKGLNLTDILFASFPMGSMTGAPKIEAMKAIERHENYRRNVYSGSIGLIKPNQDAMFNVVIRTAIIQNGELFYGVGGAITSDSDPETEWQETELKTQALLNALHQSKNINY